jgi:hypothetical protein
MAKEKMCQACGKALDLTERGETYKTCMHANSEILVCDSDCMNDFYENLRKPKRHFIIFYQAIGNSGNSWCHKNCEVETENGQFVSQKDLVDWLLENLDTGFKPTGISITNIIEINKSELSDWKNHQ